MNNSSQHADFMVGGVFGVIICLGIVSIILYIIANWKVFGKAGKPGWHSIIPILGTWDWVELSWSRSAATWYTVLSLLFLFIRFVSPAFLNLDDPAIASIFVISSYALNILLPILGLIAMYKFSKAFGKGFGFFLGLLFLNIIFYLIIGFGSSEYQGQQE